MVVWLLALQLSLASPEAERHAACEAALAAEDEQALLACVERWVIEAPRSGYTDFYGFHLAVMRGDATAASAARVRASSKGGVPEEKLREIQKADLPENPLVAWSHRMLGVVVLIMVVALVGLRVRSVTLAAQGRYEG